MRAARLGIVVALLAFGPARARAAGHRLPLVGLDDCCAPQALATAQAHVGVSAAVRDGDALCVELTAAAPPTTLAALAAALGAAGFAPAGPPVAATCVAPAPVDRWAGAAGLDFAVASRGEAVPFKAMVSSGKVTVVEFGAVWCAPCAEMAATLTAAARARPGLALRAVELPGADARASFAAPVARQHLAFAEGIPWLVVLSPRGKVLYAGTEAPAALAAADAALAAAAR